MQIVKLLDAPVQIGVTGFLTAKGEYDALETYAVGDVVSYQGSSYVMYDTAVAGTDPTTTANWQILINANDYVNTLTNFTLTNATTDNTISVVQNGNVGTAVATDGAVHIVNTGNTGIGLGVYTNIGATGAGDLVSLSSVNSAFEKRVLLISGANVVGDIFRVTQAGAMNTSTRSAIVLENTANSAGKIVNLRNTNASSSVTCLEINGNGTGRLAVLADTGTGSLSTVYINRTGNNAGKLFAIKIDVANAGAGGFGGIDFSGMSTGALFKVVADATDPTSGGGAGAGRIPIDIGGTIFYLAYYS